MDEELYRFIKLKSETFPVAIIRRSLIKHGYQRKDVDEAARRVILEESSQHDQKEKRDIFNTFGPDREAVLRKKIFAPDIEYLPLSSLRKKDDPSDSAVMSSLDSMAGPKKPKQSLADYDKLIDDLKHEAEDKVKTESAEAGVKLAQEVKSVEKEEGESISIVPAVDKKREPKHILKLGIRLKNLVRPLSDVDPIKLTYFILAMISLLGVMLSLVIFKKSLYEPMARFILGSAVILILAHSIRHLELKYGLAKHERNAFEISFTMGLLGWILSSLFSPAYIILLLVPGIFFLTILIKRVYQTSTEIALKMSALTAAATLFGFYGVSIVLGVILGLRALV